MQTDLVVAAQHGDQDAFAVLVDTFGGRLESVAQRILRDSDLAEDATQRALLRIWQSLPKLRDPSRFEAWSYQLLIRSCYAEARRTRHWIPGLRLFDGDEPTHDPHARVVDHDQLERAFRALSLNHRAVVVLHHYLDLPVEAVAEAIGIPPGTVRSRLHYAMKALRAAIEADARPTLKEATS
jgi:RNA polymerase sigma-70 factor (ECF subfamily)